MLSSITSIFASIVTGVSLILGLRYIKSLKEKTSAATFSFWTQLSIRIYEILSRMKQENGAGLLDNLFSQKARIEWPDMAPKIEAVYEFKKKIEDLLDFIENTPDQMPAYVGWTEDYKIIISFFNDIINYDIANPNKLFKYNAEEPIDINVRNNYYYTICSTMERICDGITKKQKETERKIYRL